MYDFFPTNGRELHITEMKHEQTNVPGDENLIY